MKWAVGDKCFFRFSLCEITRIDQDSGYVTCITDGYFSTSASCLDAEIFPIDREGKKLSEDFTMLYKLLSSQDRVILNFSGVYQKLVELWRDAMTERQNPDHGQHSCAYAREFVEEISKKYREIKEFQIYGVKPFV